MERITILPPDCNKRDSLSSKPGLVLSVITVRWYRQWPLLLALLCPHRHAHTAINGTRIKVHWQDKKKKGYFCIFSAFVLSLPLPLNQPNCKTGPKQFFVVPASVTVALQLKYPGRSHKCYLAGKAEVITPYSPPFILQRSALLVQLAGSTVSQFIRVLTKAFQVA